MFNKIKALKDVRSQAKIIEKALESVSATGTSHGVHITMNGKQEILSVSIPEGMDRAEIETRIKEAFANTIKEVQKLVQKVMQETGGLPDLSQFGL